MEETIQYLFEELRNITASYLIYHEKTTLEQIKKVIPQIQEYVLWFLEKNRLRLEQELYQGMCQNLLYILEDIRNAMEQEDEVLLHDAVAYGLMEYLELFLDKQQEGNSV